MRGKTDDRLRDALADTVTDVRGLKEYPTLRLDWPKVLAFCMVWGAMLSFCE
jgi:hypothetical protein